ncbi:hypothetical protein THAOC_33894 [Thalassiosira oceanica]|uniref:Uncharacterized protein n=1 Tax=Thalassiosira oceanica TaxID=159749 RepID=K0R628_THAOC|nr:hypothetical protein THAOC_33894 [Thalassiosira oceanica]|eukprot:EJK47389.1 hypothetical protein THAOC_33894 [Thalassiosira oceanica]
MAQHERTQTWTTTNNHKDFVELVDQRQADSYARARVGLLGDVERRREEAVQGGRLSFHAARPAAAQGKRQGYSVELIHAANNHGSARILPVAVREVPADRGGRRGGARAAGVVVRVGPRAVRRHGGQPLGPGSRQPVHRHERHHPPLLPPRERPAAHHRGGDVRQRLRLRRPARPGGPPAQAALPGHRRRGAPRQDEPAAQPPLPVRAGGQGAGRDGGQGPGRPRGAGHQAAPLREAVGLKRHHARDWVHARPVRLPPLLHPEARQRGPGLAGPQGRLQRRVGAGGGRAQDHEPRARAAGPAGQRPEPRPRPARARRRPHHARARHARGPLLHTQGGGHVRPEVRRGGREEEAAERIRPQAENARRGCRGGGDGAAREQAQAAAADIHPRAQGVPGQRVLVHTQPALSRRELRKARGRRGLPLLLCRE